MDMRQSFYLWRHLILNSDRNIGNVSESDVRAFERECEEKFGESVTNQWVRWCEKLQRVGMYK